MRRFIQAVAMAGVLVPSVALAHNGDEPESGGAGTTASTTEASGSNSTTTSTTTAGTQVDRPQSGATTPWGSVSDRIHGSILILDQSTTPETIFAGAQQSQIPSYQWWFSLRPRFYITRDLSVRVRADLTYEWVQGAADTTHLYEPQWGDLWTDLVYSGFPTLAGIKFSAGLRALWPISLQSQMRGTYVALGATVGASRAFDLGAGSDLTFGLSFAGTHTFTNTNNAGGLTGGSTYGCSSFGGETPQTCDSTGGPMNSAFNLLSILTVGWNTPLHGLSVNLMYLLSNAWAYDTTAPEQTTNMNGVSAEVMPEPGGANNMRQLEWFLASVDYEVTSFLTMSLGYYCYRPVLDPDSRYGNPFWSPGGNSRIFLTATIPLDGLYNTLTGSSHEATAATNRRGASNIETVRRLREQAIINGTF